MLLSTSGTKGCLHSAYMDSPVGCTLKSDKREFKVDVDDDDTEQQLSIKAVRKPPLHTQYLFKLSDV